MTPGEQFVKACEVEALRVRLRHYRARAIWHWLRLDAPDYTAGILVMSGLN